MRRVWSYKWSASTCTIFCALIFATTAHAQTMQVQETPSVLLPGSYWDELRAPLKVGDSAPDWTLPRAAYDSKSPEKIQLSKWRDGKNFNGSVVIFWAFWCDTWKDMTRDLNLLRPQLGAMKLQVLAVSVDASQQPVSRGAFESGRIWWPVAIDSASTCTARWGVRRVPTIFVLDKDGVIRAVHEGFPGKQTFLQQTAAALKLKLPSTKRNKQK